jgi:hypothetical protein
MAADIAYGVSVLQSERTFGTFIQVHEFAVCSQGEEFRLWPHSAGMIGGCHRGHWAPADLPAEQDAGVGPTPGSASGPRDP